MTANPIYPGVKIGPGVSVRETERYRITSMPQEILTLIQALLNPRDNGALSSANRALFSASDPAGAASMRAESTKSIKLQEVRLLLEQNPCLLSTQKLKLNISESDVTDSELENIVSHFPNIIEININKCPALTDEGLRSVATLKCLTTFRWTWSDQITDRGLTNLASSKSLTALDVSGCPYISGSGLRCLAESGKLTFLNVSGCKQISDKGLRFVAEFKNLTTLNLAGCSQLTDQGIQSLASMTKLTTLNLAWCPQFTDQARQYLASHLVNLVTFNTEGCDQSQFSAFFT